MSSVSRLTSALVCASHSPLMYCYGKEPAEHAAVNAVFAARAAAVREFDPELVFIFGPDHYSTFFGRLTPPYCVGAACESLGDIGGHPGRFNVQRDIAIACVAATREAGIDVAISYDLKVDHGVSQTLHRVAGAVDAYPTIPVVFDIMTPPIPPFRRARMLGEAIGNFAKGLGKRVLFIGSGGLSHNPVMIFPPYGTGEADIFAYQESGPGGGAMSRQAWLDHMEAVHLAGARELSSGRITAADCMLNESIDGKFLEMVTSGRLDLVDSWKPDDLIAQAGVGSVEIQTWLAACSASKAAGGALPVRDFYAPIVDYGIATGVIHA